jgi:predicted DCC family thiol-disulfide oxidoreductase YuxK
MPIEMTTHRIVIFDGVCNLCSWSVRFIVRRDPEGRFRFAALQSDAGQRLLEEHGLDPGNMETVLLIKQGKMFARSDAALEIARELRGLWKVLAVFRIVPRGLRDWAYSVVARNRYRWFGKQEACLVPSEELRGRFLD